MLIETPIALGAVTLALVTIVTILRLVTQSPSAGPSPRPQPPSSASKSRKPHSRPAAPASHKEVSQASVKKAQKLEKLNAEIALLTLKRTTEKALSERDEIRLHRLRAYQKRLGGAFAEALAPSPSRSVSSPDQLSHDPGAAAPKTEIEARSL